MAAPEKKKAQQEPAAVWVSVDSLTPWQDNPRKNDQAVESVAQSIKRFGFASPIIAREKDGTIIAGHTRLKAAQVLGLKTVPVRYLNLDPTDSKLLALADNRLGELADWDEVMLAEVIEELRAEDAEIEFTGWDDSEIQDLIDSVAEPVEGLTDPDEIPEPPEEPITKPGDLWQLGDHRLLCGDSTRAADFQRLMGEAKALLMHADPPYGMGKESDGVANDNIYNEKLDRFQMDWWTAVRPFLTDNASAYIWGNPPGLWRLWYHAGLGLTEEMALRNQIVWDKKFIPGMASPLLTQYPIASESCLFFQLGEQFLGNINTADFPDSWENLRSGLESEAIAAGIKAADIKRICGVNMYSHWFTKSQFTLIPKKYYATLAESYPGHFERPWRTLKKEWDRVLETRAYFDNTHDIMHDIWQFPRVVGEERFGHATPKPVAMMERIMNSSLPGGGVCVEPFGGSGSTLMAAERTGRTCFVMELSPEYCDVIVKRWEDFTGKKAELLENA